MFNFSIFLFLLRLHSRFLDCTNENDCRRVWCQRRRRRRIRVHWNKFHKKKQIRMHFNSTSSNFAKENFSSALSFPPAQIECAHRHDSLISFMHNSQFSSKFVQLNLFSTLFLLILHYCYCWAEVDSLQSAEKAMTVSLLVELNTCWFYWLRISLSDCCMCTKSVDSVQLKACECRQR